MAVYETGIDASRYQGEINWPAVAAAGKQFAILRIGSTSSGGIYVDPYFLKNVTGAHSANLKVGAYYYTYARTREAATAELDVFLNVLSGLRLEYPVFVDVEDNSLRSLGRAQLTDLVQFQMDVLDQSGWYPGYYSYTNFAANYLDTARLAAYPFWVADYRGYVGHPGSYDLWQYSSTGRVNGISGNVDLNYSYKNFLPILQAGGYNGYGSSAPVMQPITGKDMEVFNARCEYFYSANVNDVAGYLPLGRYPATALSEGEYGGFVWVNFTYEGAVWWTALLPDRCRLVDAQGGCEACEEELARLGEKLDTVQGLLEQALDELEG